MFNKKFTLVFLLAVSGSFLLANACLADVSLLNVSPVGDPSVPTLIGYIIKAILGIVGAVALFMFVYGGVMMIVSGGKPEKIQTGKSVLTWAVIGLAVIFSSYLLVNFIISGLTKGSSGGGTSGSSSDQALCTSQGGKCINVRGVKEYPQDQRCTSIHNSSQGIVCGNIWIDLNYPGKRDEYTVESDLCGSDYANVCITQYTQ